MGLPALDAFPRKLWSRLAAREIRRTRPAMIWPIRIPPATVPLREMIASYLGLSRGITISPEQVWVTGGFQGALSLIISAVLRPGDAVWVEDPGYPPARDALLAARARLVPIPVDGHGMRVDTAIETGAESAPGAGHAHPSKPARRHFVAGAAAVATGVGRAVRRLDTGR